MRGATVGELSPRGYVNRARVWSGSCAPISRRSGGDRRGGTEAGHRHLGDTAQVDPQAEVDGKAQLGLDSEEFAEIQRLVCEVTEMRPCTVARLMRKLCLASARRRKWVRSTIPGPTGVT
jgi:hypothetical protein